MARVLFWLVHLTWGLPQTLVGAVVALIYRHSPHEWYHGALVTHWPSPRGLSMGPFIFVCPEGRDGYDKLQMVHEFGHCVQSLVSGPLYLLVFALPSIVWAGVPAFNRMRARRHMSYYAFYPERLANFLGERTTGNPSPGQRV